MEWIALIVPLIREGINLAEQFQRDNGRPITDAELAASLQERSRAEVDWQAELARRRSAGT